MLSGDIKIEFDLPSPTASQLNSLLRPPTSEIAVNTNEFLLAGTKEETMSEQQKTQDKKSQSLGVPGTKLALLDPLSSIFVILDHFRKTRKNLVGINFIRTTFNAGLYIVDVGNFDTKTGEIHVNQGHKNKKNPLICLPDIVIPVKT